MYPRKFLASQLLGFVGTDNTGPRPALEQQHDDELRGSDGKRLLVKDALGDAIKLDDERTRRSPGKDLTLTIDDRIQERDGGGPRRGRREVPARQGRDRDRDGPAQRRAARGRQLAARRRQRVERRAGRGPRRTARCRPPTSRARRSRRSRWPARCEDEQGHAGHDVPAPGADPGRRPRRSARPTTRATARSAPRASCRSPPTSARS